MKKLRKLHLFLGCLFAPTIVLFAITGSLQMFHLHEAKKGGDYVVPVALKILSAAHENELSDDFIRPDESCYKLSDSTKVIECERKSIEEQRQSCISCETYPYFVALVAIGLVLSALTGVLMALQMSKQRRTVCWCLGVGTFIPMLLIWMQMSAM